MRPAVEPWPAMRKRPELSIIIRSPPPRSMNLALMPVPAPAAMIGSPRLSAERRRSITSLRVYGFPFPVHGFGIVVGLNGFDGLRESNLHGQLCAGVSPEKQM